MQDVNPETPNRYEVVMRSIVGKDITFPVVHIRVTRTTLVVDCLNEKVGNFHQIKFRRDTRQGMGPHAKTFRRFYFLREVAK